VYHEICEEELPVRVTEPGPQLLPFIKVGGAGLEFTLTTTGIRRLLQILPAST
jgi:hypothetical protein